MKNHDPFIRNFKYDLERHNERLDLIVLHTKAVIILITVFAACYSILSI